MDSWYCSTVSWLLTALAIWWATAGHTRHQFTVIVFRELPKSVQFFCAIFQSRPEFLKSNNTVTEANCRQFFIYIYLISDELCLQDFCKGTSKWHSNEQQLLWPQICARWHGQMGWLHHSWRTPHPDNRSSLPRQPPEVHRCCSVNWQGKIRDRV